MKKSVAEKWVKALRGKKYKQGRSVLKKKDKKGVTRHCCLGVLCELYQQFRRENDQNPLPVKIEDANDYHCEMKKGERVFHFGDETTHLPDRVMRWAGISTSDCEFDGEELVGDAPYYDLVAMNDQGSTFKRLADVIEKHQKEL